MHYHCEIVIPPTEDVEKAMAAVLKPFDEQPEEKDEDSDTRHAFWDFYVIGGRWAGHKLLAKYDQTQLDAFHAWLTEEKVTVSGLTCGKQELSPATQIAKVDAKWNAMFPSDGILPCPLFQHSNNQYSFGGLEASTLPGDIARLVEVPTALKCTRAIFAGPSYDTETKTWTGPLEAKFMLAEDAWNGCNHMKVDWDGKFHTALAAYSKTLEHCREEYAEKVRPHDDWLAVTVDYHS